MRGPRRSFLSALAGLPLVPAGARAAEAEGFGPVPTPPAAEQALAEGLLAAARARFALAPDEVEGVKKGIVWVLDASAKMRGIPLANADEPALTFEARPPALRGRA
jgi:hypothetical protein